MIIHKSTAYFRQYILMHSISSPGEASENTLTNCNDAMFATQPFLGFIVDKLENKNFYTSVLSIFMSLIGAVLADTTFFSIVPLTVLILKT